jgi:S-DNA-T family DNA segregation ATPase FtsK/SpoIIIE
MIRTWTLDDDGVRRLPARHWKSAAPADVPAPVPAELADRPALRLVKAEVPAQAGPVSNRDRVLQAVREGARTARDIVDRTGLNKGTVSREVKSLVASGSLVKGDDGMLTAGEVSA